MKKNEGISLIEVLVSILILSLIIGPFIGVFIQSQGARAMISEQLEAIYKVRNEMEILMAKDALDAYNSNGIKEYKNFFIRTSIAPYSVISGGECFYIMIGDLNKTENLIVVFTPHGYKTFLLENHEGYYDMNIDIGNTFFKINIGNESISGELDPSRKPNIEINFISEKNQNLLNFAIKGDAHIIVYPGHNKYWGLDTDNDFKVMENCFYRDYITFNAQIGIYKTSSPTTPIFEISNIIKNAY